MKSILAAMTLLLSTHAQAALMWNCETQTEPYHTVMVTQRYDDAAQGLLYTLAVDGRSLNIQNVRSGDGTVLTAQGEETIQVQIGAKAKPKFSLLLNSKQPLECDISNPSPALMKSILGR
jgi:hypothetical protein